jgi:hypothetical protein
MRERETFFEEVCGADGGDVEVGYECGKEGWA